MHFLPGFLKYATGMFSHSVVSQEWLQKRVIEGVGTVATLLSML